MCIHAYSIYKGFCYHCRLNKWFLYYGRLTKKTELLEEPLAVKKCQLHKTQRCIHK